MAHVFGHGGLGQNAEIVNPKLNLKRYVEGDIYAGLVLLNDSPTSVDATQYEYNLGVFSNKFAGGNAAPGAEGGEQSQPNDGAEASKEDDVIDADFEEVDDDKKASGQ